MIILPRFQAWLLIFKNIMENILSITIIKNKALSLLDDFKKHLEEKKSTRIYNTSCFNSAYKERTNDRTIYFYEFSDLKRLPLKFSKVSDFMDWAKKHSVYLSSYTETQLRDHETSYCTCFRNSSSVMIRSSYELLKMSQKNLDDSNKQYHIGNLGEGLYGNREAYYSDWD